MIIIIIVIITMRIINKLKRNFERAYLIHYMNRSLIRTQVSNILSYKLLSIFSVCSVCSNIVSSVIY